MRLQLALGSIVIVLLAPAAALGQSDEAATVATSDILFYSDDDSVVVVSPQVGASAPLDEDGGRVSGRVVLDAISAASVDVVSSATYRFSELRSQVDLSVSKAIGHWLPSLAYRASHEPDYDSHGFTLGVERDLAGGDATLSANASLVVDSIGRTGTPRDAFSERLTSQSTEVSYTQTINPMTLVRLAYTLTSQFGYMEKPYRSVPLFDDSGLAAAQMAGDSIGLETFDRYRLDTKPAEEVPDTRYRHAIAARGLRYIAPLRASVRVDYRFYTDSWGIQAHTGEAALYRQMTAMWRVNAWTRLHWQSSASFWREIHRVTSGELPAFRSVDRSLSRSTHYTGGLRLERDSEHFGTYLELSVMHSRFPAFLFLDTRNALMTQAGVRWRF